MGLKKLFDKVTKSPCAKCPYTLGQVKTLVNPCPQCKINGYCMFERFINGEKGESTDEK